MSQNMQWALTRRFEQGIFTSYRAFIGYRCVNGVLVIVPEQAEVVRMILDKVQEEIFRRAKFVQNENGKIKRILREKVC